MTTGLNRGSTNSPSGEKLWSNIFQQQIPEDQKVAFQKLIQELLERRKTVKKLWKYVIAFICIGILASIVYYFFTCWSDYLELIETKYIIRAEIFDSVRHHSLIPWNLTNSVEAPVCLGISLKSFGEPSSKTTEKVAGIMAIVALVMIFKGFRLGWNIWNVQKARLDLEDLQNNPIEVLAETLRKDFLSHIAESGLLC